MNDELRTALDHEVNKSDLRRARMLAGLFGAATVMFTTVSFAFYDRVEEFTNGRLHRAAVLALFSSVVVVELVLASSSSRSLRTGARPSPIVRTVVAALEPAVTSAGLVVAATVFGPLFALHSPAAYVSFLFIAMSAMSMDFRVSLVTAVSAAVQYLLVSFWLLAPVPGDAYQEPFVAWQPYVVKAAVLVITGVVTGLIAANVRRQAESSLRTIAEKRRVVDLFGQQVSDAVVDKLLSQTDELQSETRYVCVLFLDIRDFTTFAEKRRPEEVVSYLNDVWGALIDVVNAHGGIINKFLGDGFMATFGAPVSDGSDCRNAVRAARAILVRLEADVRSGAIPPTRVGIGLHAGTAVTGNVGGPRRREYSVIGDVVNLASRIEGLCKSHHAQLLMSGEVHDAVRDELTGAELVGPVNVKGREQPVQVWKVA